jgi:hypothetical protein
VRSLVELHSTKNEKDYLAGGFVNGGDDLHGGGEGQLPDSPRSVAAILSLEREEAQDFRPGTDVVIF